MSDRPRQKEISRNDTASHVLWMLYCKLIGDLWFIELRTLYFILDEAAVPSKNMRQLSDCQYCVYEEMRKKVVFKFSCHLCIIFAYCSTAKFQDWILKDMVNVEDDFMYISCMMQPRRRVHLILVFHQMDRYNLSLAFHQKGTLFNFDKSHLLYAWES